MGPLFFGGWAPKHAPIEGCRALLNKESGYKKNIDEIYQDHGGGTCALNAAVSGGDGAGGDDPNKKPPTDKVLDGHAPVDDDDDDDDCSIVPDGSEVPFAPDLRFVFVFLVRFFV